MEKIKKFFNKLTVWLENLNSNEKLVVALISLIIIAILSFGVSKIKIGEKSINYKEINIANINALEASNDKDLYVKCDAFTKRIIESYYKNYTISNVKVDVDDFYKLSKLDQYNISKSKFNKKFKTIIEELRNEKNASSNDIDTFYPIIKDIYVYSEKENMYFIKFDTNEEHVLGVQIKDNYFYIFYLE